MSTYGFAIQLGLVLKASPAQQVLPREEPNKEGRASEDYEERKIEHDLDQDHFGEYRCTVAVHLTGSDHPGPASSSAPELALDELARRRVDRRGAGLCHFLDGVEAAQFKHQVAVGTEVG